MIGKYCTTQRLLAVLHDCRFAGGISASGQSSGFGGNLFTRDTLRILRDVMQIPSFRPFIREMLAILPQWQGIEVNTATNESPDALSHQVFREFVGGRKLPDKQVEQARYWTDQWGIDMTNDPVAGHQFVIYNSSDGPLLYLITLAEFCKLNSRTILKDQFMHWPTGEVRNIGDAAHRCIDFVVRMIVAGEEQGWGLYAVPNTNPKQTSPSGVMRDGWDAYVHPVRPNDETLLAQPADYSYMAYLDNQALCYEALLAAQELFPDDENVPTWLHLAKEIRRRTFQMLWRDDVQFFAPALDQHGLLKFKSNVALELLNGPFFDGVKDGPDYIRALVTWLYSKEVMTPIGPRMISLEDAGLEEDYYAYQGSGAVWSVTNGIIANGLRRQGLHSPAYDLGYMRLLGWFEMSQAVLELSYVHRASNIPAYRTEPQTPAYASYVVAAAEMGQINQAWGASAALRTIWKYPNGIRPPRPSRGSWQGPLSHDLQTRTGAVLPAAVLTQDPNLVQVDTRKGGELKQRRIKMLNVR